MLVDSSMVEDSGTTPSTAPDVDSHQPFLNMETDRSVTSMVDFEADGFNDAAIPNDSEDQSFSNFDMEQAMVDEGSHDIEDKIRRY